MNFLAFDLNKAKISVEAEEYKLILFRGFSADT